MPPFSRKNFWVCKLVANDHDGTWPNKLCNGTNYLQNKCCRFCDGARPPPWKSNEGGGGNAGGKKRNAEAKQSRDTNKGEPNNAQAKNTKAKPARLDQKYWQALTKEQRNRYKAGTMTKTDAEDIAKAAIAVTAKDSEGAMECDSEQTGDERVSMVERDFHTKTSCFFNKLIIAKQPREEFDPHTELQKKLPASTRASVAATAREKKVQELDAAMAQNAANTTLVGALKFQRDALQAEMDAENAAASNPPTALTEMRAYRKVAEDIQNQSMLAKTKREGHKETAENTKKEFKALLVQVRSSLDMLDSQFDEYYQQYHASWEKAYNTKDSQSEALIKLAEQEAAAAEAKMGKKVQVAPADVEDTGKTESPKTGSAMPASPKPATDAGASTKGAAKVQQTGTESTEAVRTDSGSQAVATTGQTIAAQPMQTAAAATAAAAAMPKWYQQKTHYVAVEPKDLANVQNLDWGIIDMEELHRGWHVLQAIQMQPANLAFNYGIFGMEPTTLEAVIGSEAFSKIFAGASVGDAVKITPEDVVTDQVINLLRVQMQKLSDRLQEESEKAVEEGNALVQKYLPSLKQERDKRGASPY